ncbi:hypothetical protein D0863_15638 [Hortaea werneckii]|uniref:Uncharacterized protein n=1 Tax=Hortaea werneckii TaxID=91943 RepID=A0A3M7C5Z8_HORWE|nr:hypothetical protein D0863_15638 [Hortaea werneckii]
MFARTAMRLLYRDAQGTYHLKEIADALEERYAILSHRWYPEGDILYADLANQHRPEIRDKQGWRKLRYAVDQAERDGYRYVWIDTCCIDKTSSAELSEAINSMFFWYQQAQVCYAYLWDISGECPPLSDKRAPRKECDGSATPDGDQDGQAPDTDSESELLLLNNVLHRTLQELIAPREVRFFGVDWNRLGSSHQLVETIAARTLIDADLLRGLKELKRYSIAQRMSWAADRMTSRIEDRAYSLLGLFDVNIPLLYGERERAFMRLQEEIIRRSNDQSILAWGYDMAVDENPGMLLARSPTDFRGSNNIAFRESYSGGKALQLDSQALRGSSLVRYEGDGLWTARLNCEDSSEGQIKLGIVRRDSFGLYERRTDPDAPSRHSQFDPERLFPLGDPAIVAVARSGHGFCSRITSSRALAVPGSSLPVDAWRTPDEDMTVAEELAKLRIVLSRGNENFYCGPLKMSVCAFKGHDRGSLEVLGVVPRSQISAVTSLPDASSLKPVVVTRFTYNDAAALLIRIKNLNETLEVTCTAKYAIKADESKDYICRGSLVVKRHTRKSHDRSWSLQAWRNYVTHREYRFSGHAATFTLTLKDGWKFSARMTVVGITEPEVELEFETLPPPTSRMGKMGGLKRLVDREDGKVGFEAF